VEINDCPEAPEPPLQMSEWTLKLCREHQNYQISHSIPSELWQHVFSYLRPWHSQRQSVFSDIKTVEIVTTNLPTPLRIWGIRVGAPTRRNPGTEGPDLFKCCNTRETQLYIENPVFATRRLDGPTLIMGPRSRRLSGGIPFVDNMSQLTVRGLTFEFGRSPRGTIGLRMHSIGHSVQCLDDSDRETYQPIHSPEGQQLIDRYRLRPFLENFGPFDNRSWRVEFGSQLMALN
jgi:hypothetical protein